MCDVYEFVKMTYTILQKFYFFTMYHQIPIVVKKAETLCLDTLQKVDISYEISCGKNFKYASENSIVKIDYFYNTTPYVMIYHKDNPQSFPPYKLSTFTKRVRPGISSILINNKNFTNYLKKFAGPKQNFYSDIEDYSGMNFAWTNLHNHYNISDDAKVEIMNSFGDKRTIFYNADPEKKET